jgi:hypothetical protein
VKIWKKSRRGGIGFGYDTKSSYPVGLARVKAKTLSGVGSGSRVKANSLSGGGRVSRVRLVGLSGLAELT